MPKLVIRPLGFSSGSIRVASGLSSKSGSMSVAGVPECTLALGTPSSILPMPLSARADPVTSAIRAIAPNVNGKRILPPEKVVGFSHEKTRRALDISDARQLIATLVTVGAPPQVRRRWRLRRMRQAAEDGDRRTQTTGHAALTSAGRDRALNIDLSCNNRVTSNPSAGNEIVFLRSKKARASRN